MFKSLNNNSLPAWVREIYLILLALIIAYRLLNVFKGHALWDWTLLRNVDHLAMME